MSLGHVPLFLSTRDVPLLLADLPGTVQEAVVADLELLQGGLLQPILRVRDDALSRLLLDEARDDHRVLRRDQRRRLVRRLGGTRFQRLLLEAPTHARRLAGQVGVRAVLGESGTLALLRYASLAPATTGAAAERRSEEVPASELDLALLGLACVAHRLHPPIASERLARLAGLAHESMDRLRVPAVTPAQVRRTRDMSVAEATRDDWTASRAIRQALPPSWLAPLPLIEADSA